MSGVVRVVGALNKQTMKKLKVSWAARTQKAISMAFFVYAMMDWSIGDTEGATVGMLGAIALLLSALYWQIDKATE